MWATVAGSRLDGVYLEREADGVVGWCTCPQSEGGTACKHLWATIPAAEQRKWWRGIGPPTWFDLDGPDGTFADDPDDVAEALPDPDVRTAC